MSIDGEVLNNIRRLQDDPLQLIYETLAEDPSITEAQWKRIDEQVVIPLTEKTITPAQSIRVIQEVLGWNEGKRWASMMNRYLVLHHPDN